jgi:hypothetical protein
MTDAAPASPDVTAGAALARAALYLRVSTGRQAESDLSIPDQRRQITACCVAKGWELPPIPRRLRSHRFKFYPNEIEPRYGAISGAKLACRQETVLQ